MSKGEIVSSEGAGRYVVRVVNAVETLQEELERINKELAELAVTVADAKLAVIQAQTAADSIRHQIDLAIDDYRQDPDANRSRLTDLQSQLVAKQADVARLEYARDVLIVKNLSLLKRRGAIESVPASRQVEAWCADFTEGLAGDVGLVDINDEGGQGVIIQPGFDGSAMYQPSRDGMLLPREALSPEQSFFNLAILPGVQKWFPRYRLGVISDLDGDSCTVTLDDALSSAQDLDINQQRVLTAVPIQYMDCNGAAFSDGDRVLVRFTDNGPLVIGFEREPVPCADLSLAFLVVRYFVEQPSQVSDAVVYGAPYETGEGAPINPPIGSAGGNPGTWTLNYKSGEYTITKGRQQNYGYRNWIGENGLVLSWMGPPTRMYDVHGLGDPAVKNYPSQPGGYRHWRQDWAADRYVFYQNRVLWEFASFVHGAAIWTDAGRRFLVAVVGGTQYHAEQGQVVRVELTEYLYPVEGAAEEILHTFDYSATMRSMTDWYFNRSGDRAVCTTRDSDAGGTPSMIYRLDLDLSAGFTFEQLWSSDTVVGSSTLHYENLDEPYPSNYKRREVSRSVNLSGHERPLYVDYVGDEMVHVGLRLPAYNSSSTAIGTKDQAGTGPYVETYSLDATDAAGSPAEIITDTGRVMATAPFVRSETKTVDQVVRSHSDLYGNRWFTGQMTDRVTGFFANSDELTVVAIDARFEFCAVYAEYTESDYSVIYSNPVPHPNDSLLPYWSRTFSGSRTDTGKLLLFMRGKSVADLTVFVNDEVSSTSQSVALAGYPPSYGALGFTRTTDVVDRPQTQYGSRGLMWGAGFTANGQTACSVVFHEPSSDGAKDPVWFSMVEPYSDVIAELLEQDQSAGFVLDRLSVI